MISTLMKKGYGHLNIPLNLRENGGHAMCIIAYDDNKFDGAFLVQNSWGEDWGKDGYFWLPYSEITEHDYGCRERKYFLMLTL